MKRSILGAAILTLGLALGAGLSGEAKAFSGVTLAVDGGRAANGALLLKVDHKKKHWHRKHWHKDHRRHDRGPGFVINLGGLFAPQPVVPQSNCQQVVRDGYAYGRPAKLASTLCYDQYGRGYIVPGSDQVLQLY